MMNRLKPNSFVCIEGALVFFMDLSNGKIIFSPELLFVFCIGIVQNALAAPGPGNTNLAYDDIFILRYFFIAVPYVVKYVEHGNQYRYSISRFPCHGQQIPYYPLALFSYYTLLDRVHSF